MAQVAEELGISDNVSGKNLQLLELGGFLERKRAGRYAYYFLVRADGLLQAVLDDLGRPQENFSETIHVLTALTHERRIRILFVLAPGELEFAQLGARSGISLRALERHVDKLVRRGFVAEQEGRVRVLFPDSKFGRYLLVLAQRSGTPSKVCGDNAPKL